MADISVALELDDKQYTQALKRAGQEGEKFAKETEQRLKKTESAFAGLGKVIAGLGFSALITQSIQLGARLSNLSDAAQISIGRIKGLQDAFANSGGTADKAADGISDLIKNIGEAAGGSNELIASFQKVGVSLTDLQNLSEQDILRKVIAGLAKIPDSATRSAVGMKLMGESIKGVDLANVNDSFDKFSIKAANLDKSAKSAAQAQQALSNAFNDVQVGVLAGLEPLTKSIAQLAKNTEGIATFVEYAVKIGTVVATFFAVGKAVQLAVGAFKFLSAAVATAGGPIQLVTNVFRNFQLILGQLNQLGGPVVGLFKVMRANISELGAWIKTAIPIVTTLGVAFSVFADDIKKAYNALKEFFGFGNMDDSYLKKEEARARAVQEQTEARQRLLKVLVDEKAALESQLTAYNAANAAVLKKLQSETELIGKSEEYKKKVQELNQAESSYLTEVSKLREQYNKAASPEQKEQITAAEARLTEEYNKQRAAIEEAVAAQEGKVRINNLERFSIDSLIQGNAEIQRIQDQIAKVTMPALERAYYDVEAAAKASAEAAIAAEEIRRGLAPGSMAEAERIQYYEAAAIRVRELQAATYELAKAESAREAGLAIARERLQIENDIRRVQDEMATMTMSEIEKKEYAIKRAAEDRARAYIAAEEARTGVKMSGADQNKIIKEYVDGTAEVIKNTRQAHEESRSWATGWKQAMNDYVSNATNAAQRAKNVFSVATKGMEDLIVNFAKTGKFEWQGFLNSIVEQLLRSEIQSLIARTFGGLGGGSKSSGGGLLSGLFSGFSGFFAEGGKIAAGKWGIAGEAGPEIISGPATVTPMSDVASGSNTVNISYNISAVDARSFQQLVAQDPEFIYAVTLKGQSMMPKGIR